MPLQKEEKFFDRQYESATASGPGTGDLLVINYEQEFQLTELILDLANEGSVQIEERDDGGGNAETLFNISETLFQDGDFEDPVAEIGSGREVAIVAAESLSGEVNVNARTHIRRV